MSAGGGRTTGKESYLVKVECQGGKCGDGQLIDCPFRDVLQERTKIVDWFFRNGCYIIPLKVRVK